jgi:hypothetical protein
VTIKDIIGFSEESKLRWTSHILERLFQRNIKIDDIKTALMNGEIIEQYPTDYPFPSCLVLGYTKTGVPLHIVCGSNDVGLWLVTAYFPDLSEWFEDFKQRRKK